MVKIPIHPDIPNTYKYFRISGTNIQLFDRPYAQNQNVTYYSIPLNSDYDIYTVGTLQQGNTRIDFTELQVVKNDILNYQHADKLFIVMTCSVLLVLFLAGSVFNIGPFSARRKRL